MSSLNQDMRYALRTLRGSPGFVLAAVLALALGIGANSAVFSVVNGVLLTPPPFREPERLVHLSNDFAKAGIRLAPVSMPEYRDHQSLARVFSSVAAYVQGDLTLTGRDTPVRLGATSSTASLFSTLGVTPALGRTFTEAEEVPGRDKVVVLTQKAWRVYFAADPAVLGRSLLLDGESYTVVGVLPPGVAYPADTDLYRPFAPPPEQTTEAQRGERYLSMLGRLKPGVTLEAARQDMTRVMALMVADHPKYGNGGWSIQLRSLEDLVVGDVRGTLWMLLGAVGFVLLVACSSVANLLLARAATRSREVSIRAALGAGRGRLVAQFLTESLLLAAAGGVLGLLLAMWGTDALLTLVGESLPRAAEVKLDRWSLLFTGGMSLLTGLLFGLVPALQSSRADLSAAMRQGAKGTAEGAVKLRSGLVVAQMALALVLLVGAGLFAKSFLALRSVDVGFTPEGVLTGQLSLPATRYKESERQVAFHRELLERIQSLPGVESAGLTNILPLGGRLTRGFEIEGRTKGPGEVWPAVQFRTVSPDYLHTLRATLREGRMLDARDDAAAPGAAIINKSLADFFWPRGDAVGKRLRLGNPAAAWTTVVGVVDDLREWGVDQPARPAMYYALAQFPSADLALAVRAKDSVRASVEAELRAMDRDVPMFAVSPLSRLVDESIGSRRLSALLMGLFAGVSLVLAALGISGVIAYAVAQRTREMGIRMALGAEPGDVLRLVLGQGMRLAGLGVGVGLVLSLGLARLLGSMLYGVTAYDPWTFVGVAALLSGVALFATWLPARRATRVDPIIALRAE
ncbi:ABC transporter permease [Corallococcus sp. M34]|uniref:ABC transporter permease n=1 Tax=Citreicoccus inhibens TaxID=2849499 RepID=UPI001C215FFE|nr:ABC transporter permease [Citreicoccus inhibens]MBU8896783.1 ABC transporter permease [Citreicoccus inhibens]